MNNRQREESLTLEILEAIDAQSDVTQRHLARRTGIALGLANSYLKRCVRKGLVKMQEAPANRYFYYLTPSGFAEKSRLTASYLTYSFKFYRRAGQSCAKSFEDCKGKGWTRITLCGASDLAEIAAMRAIEHDIEIVQVFDPDSPKSRFLNHPVAVTSDSCKESDAWLLTDLVNPQDTYDQLAKLFPPSRIVVPEILGISRRD